ncbi:hypothetical protein PISMIDRAFT_682737 [Pisolithus microcarpus 441]|uniref:Uncharacterized protein n=1 Tax=Pisolithus microcarpus 441 TaxID=765257 RepID=A0A0C9Z139_9AGAM|nr:hypothetical protein BKA83DRAFT_682737 [Pisolithus microcarpus]KIK19984.1 hypothetical protein PISMIDRAFT_682737 [Pisolithus microcarpus 441]
MPMYVTITKLSSDGKCPDASVHEREEPAMAHGTLYVLWDVLLRGEAATEHVKECEESKTRYHERKPFCLYAL